MIRRTDVYSPGGLIYLGSAPAICFDRERAYPSLERMVRGLYRHHTGRLLPRDTEFRWSINEPLYGGRLQLFQAGTQGVVLGDVFGCRYRIAKENGLEASVW